MQADKDFIMEVRGKHFIGKYEERLVTFKKLTEEIGEPLATKFQKKAYEKGLDKITFKLRRGLTITFKSK